MTENIIVQKKPLFAKKEENIEKESLFKDKRKIFIIVGLLVFIVIILSLMFYFLGAEYLSQFIEKSSLFIPLLRKKY